ncbi:acyl carrier protein [bacterium]|nr:acyl carrier protein [bacterium]
MQKSEFFEKLINTIEIEENVDESTILADIEEWDSLAAVTTLALFKKHLGLNITAENLKNCKTFNDILNLGISEYK